MENIVITSLKKVDQDILEDQMIGIDVIKEISFTLSYTIDLGSSSKDLVYRLSNTTSSNFSNYSNVTEDMVIGWIKNDPLYTVDIDELKNNVNRSTEESFNSFPWND
jgi:hypothetical protein